MAGRDRTVIQGSLMGIFGLRGKKEVVANCRICHRYFTKGGPTDFRYMNRLEQGKRIYTGYLGLNAKIRKHWRKYHEELSMQDVFDL